ncbi:uncharacterized protein LOC129576960 [Sitodiplosis mosellana]|uniref:uncharacterized protein LOC129576960 n=1 Tax=Sitodiplosis mosellana TaxID=263140 RepID=UPI002443C91E|nr:uncharacterized protein LOC129576960 [Sitodiplosis mosellana]XP_055319172.1 uncharacterized protein LOC129576960 [Sitodiplosis mosellana]XP_055319173.1 uncharacterized protein LOC129576960 [Sitodiplosis mosellana]XP_055319174.1 uncharacterized protein LOC129576960 [Sitodiplosis mosellana]XP_055319175.1 uncharacterized protein LOC129576960 [Sitodiplosis mosellana]
MGIKEQSEQLINRNLVALVAVIFLFYGGLSCLYSTLVPHLLELGFTSEEIRYILTTVALISIIGPLIFAPLTDRIADRRKSSYGRYLQVIIALLLIFGSIAYGLLLLVPAVRREASREPNVSFGCDPSGGIIFQERCSEEKSCFHWEKEKVGQLILTNCSYTCQNPSQFESLYNPWLKPAPAAFSEPPSSKEKQEDYDYADISGPPKNSDSELSDGTIEARNRREVEKVYVHPPHLCMQKIVDGKPIIERCHAYTSDLDWVKVQASLRSATNKENETHSAEWCNYPLDGFTCDIPEEQIKYMKAYTGNPDCKPMIECEVSDPYSGPSVLAESQCYKIVGDIEVTYWSYLAIRSLADIFPVSIIVLLNTAIIIATRETSTGRSEIGRQLAWGAFAWCIFPLIFGIVGIHGDIFVPVIVCIVLWILAALILLFNKSIPLSPPEWWWQIYTGGMMAIPLSAIRKYTPEIIALSVVAVVLGAFWSIIDTYQPSHLLDLNLDDAPLVIKFALTVAAIPAIFILWNAERIVDYCGHANVLIAAFALHILRFTGLALMDSPWYALLTHSLESITLVLVFVTLVLYMRHLVPRRLIATGQSVPVIATLCLGNAIGTLVAPVYAQGFRHLLFRDLAIVAAIVGTLYFILYHFYLGKRCAAAQQPPPSPAELQTHNGSTQQNGASSSPSNGNSYTPLRIYHNSRGRKGQFRY